VWAELFAPRNPDDNERPMPMHDSYDGLPQRPDPDALATMVDLVELQTRTMCAAVKTFSATPRHGVEDLETLGRPLLRDLRAFATALANLAEGLHATADHVQRSLLTPHRR
jgi:hypothetical protein